MGDLVSVVLPVRNGMPFLPDAVASILNQEDVDFEVIVIDDGSSDGTADYLESIRDPRMRFVRLKNGGLVAALNLGCELAKGEFIARMDSDDVARADRLTTQAFAFTADPNLGVLCSNARVIDGQSQLKEYQRDAWDDASHVWEGLSYRRRMRPIIHPSVMLRTDLLRDLGGYRNYDAAEDRDLWMRAFPVTGFGRLQADLLFYRVHSGGVSRTRSLRQAASSAMAVVNAEVLQQAAVDMFATRPDLFARVDELLAERVSLEVLPAADALRRVRGAIRSRQWARGTALTLRGVARFGSDFQPDGARVRTRVIIDDLVSYSLNALSRSDLR